MNWMLIVVLTMTGLALIAVDFYLPSFVLGIIGVVFLLTATLVCFGSTGSVDETIILFCVEAALGSGVAYASVTYFPRTRAGKKMILAETQTGASAQSPRPDDWIGREGVAQTILRPAGVAMIGDKRLDVVAESDVIESGSPVRIVAVNENRLVVRKLG
jgi:membrane-bound serine protease (ClpP class)